MVGNQVKPGHRESWTKYSKQRERGQSPREGTESDSIENNGSSTGHRRSGNVREGQTTALWQQKQLTSCTLPNCEASIHLPGARTGTGQSSPQNQLLNNGTIHWKSETWMKVNVPWKGMHFQSVPETWGLQYYAMCFKQCNQLNSLV